MPDNSCTIRFVRPSGYVDRIRSYKMLVNGVQVGAIANGETLEVKVPAGVTTIEAKIDWAKARPLKIDTVANQTVEIEVCNRWSAWLGLWAITFGSDNYLSLTVRPAAA
jgi:hypothetical protein